VVLVGPPFRALAWQTTPVELISFLFISTHVRRPARLFNPHLPTPVRLLAVFLSVHPLDCRRSFLLSCRLTRFQTVRIPSNRGSLALYHIPLEHRKQQSLVLLEREYDCCRPVPYIHSINRYV